MLMKVAIIAACLGMLLAINPNYNRRGQDTWNPSRRQALNILRGRGYPPIPDRRTIGAECSENKECDMEAGEICNRYTYKCDAPSYLRF